MEKFTFFGNGSRINETDNVNKTYNINIPQLISIPLVIDTIFNPVEIKNIIKISTGNSHSLLLSENGNIYGLGSNSWGELGLSNHFHKTTIAIHISKISNIIDISAGDGFSLILNNEGRAYSFGNNTYDQLGLGEKYGDRNSVYFPTLISTINNIISISAGYVHSLFLDKYGHVYSCGNDEDGALGFYVEEDEIIDIPTLIDGLEDIISISAGQSHSLALSKNGQVYSFGMGGFDHNEYFGEAISDPWIVPNLFNIVSISAGFNCSLFLNNEGKVYNLGYKKNYTIHEQMEFDNYPTLIKDLHMSSKYLLVRHMFWY